MPNRDQTGPEGKGSSTGRGLGRCGKNQDDKQENRPRLGLGLGKRQRQSGRCNQN